MSKPKHKIVKREFVILEPIYKQAVEHLKLKRWQIAYAIGISREKVINSLNGEKIDRNDANRMSEFIAWVEKGKPKAYYLNEEQIKYLRKSKKFKNSYIEEAEIFFNQK